MKGFIFGCIFLTSGFVYAARDHVGVFHRMEKVIVLINESRGGQLDQLLQGLNGFGDEQRSWMSPDGTFKLSCGYNESIMGCTVRFLPSSNTNIGERDVHFEMSLNELGAAASSNIELYFESSRKDKFTLSLKNNILRIYATKRDGYSSLTRACNRYLQL